MTTTRLLSLLLTLAGIAGSAQAEAPRRVFLAGDSTVAEYGPDFVAAVFPVVGLGAVP